MIENFRTRRAGSAKIRTLPSESRNTDRGSLLQNLPQKYATGTFFFKRKKKTLVTAQPYRYSCNRIPFLNYRYGLLNLGTCTW